MTVVAARTSSRPGGELPHRALALLGRKAAVDDADAAAGERFSDLVRVLLDGARLDLVRLLDERHDDVGLAARADLGLDLAERGRALRLREDARRDRRAARRLLVERRDVEVAVERQGEGARDRRRGHDEEVRARPRRIRLCRDRRPLRDAEAVLLVDHDEAEAPELHGVLEERVRPDEHVDAAAGERVEELRAGPCPSRGRSGARRGNASCRRSGRSTKSAARRGSRSAP